MSATTLVYNETARVIAPTIKNGGRAVGLRLLPGVNRVDSADWAAALKSAEEARAKNKSRMLPWYIDNGHIRVLDEDSDLSGTPVTAAVQLVNKTFDKKLLRAWSGVEKRKPVLEAITTQLEKLDGSKPDTQPAVGTPPSSLPVTADATSARSSRRTPRKQPEAPATQSGQPAGVDVSMANHRGRGNRGSPAT